MLVALVPPTAKFITFTDRESATHIMKVIVVGSGMAGLACARSLAASNVDVMVLDKGRGVGGRLATRRIDDGSSFDHGAQYLTARGRAFSSMMQEMLQEDFAGLWVDGGDENHYVGTPGMSAIGKYLATGLDVRRASRVTEVTPHAEGWRVTVAEMQHTCSHLVITTPAPQVMELVGEAHAFAKRLSAVQMAPCLTLMATFADTTPRPFLTRRDRDDPMSWIALNASKPCRATTSNWIAQAGPAWSEENLELLLDEVAAIMAPMLCDRLGASVSDLRYTAGHRWRYALATDPLGEPYLRDESGTLYAGGDWCLAARAEAAWESGRAIAKDLLAAR